MGITEALLKVNELLEKQQIQKRPEPATWGQLITLTNTLLPPAITALKNLIGEDDDNG